MSKAAPPVSPEKKREVVTRFYGERAFNRIHGDNDIQYVENVTLSFFYTPHTLMTLGFLCMCLTGFVYLDHDEEASLAANLKTGASVGCFFILILGMMVFPSGPFTRPHPLFWRFTFGLGVLYQLFLIILLFLTKHQARQFVAQFDSSLGVPLADKEYAVDCRFRWDVIKHNVFDLYFFGHFFGWVMKAVCIRDPVICMVISFHWEIFEIAFTHMQDNFQECWWDQWLLDFACANALGIFVGLKIGKWLELKTYEWRGVNTIPTLTGKVERVMLQLTPNSWERVRWEATKSWRRFVAINIFIIMFNICDLNIFFLKHLLWMPPPCILNHLRIGLCYLCGIPAIRQVYNYITDPSCKRLGTQSFMLASIFFTELSVIIKFSPGEFPKSMPTDRAWFVAGMIVLHFVLAGAYFMFMRRRADTNIARLAEEESREKKDK